jgi:hypothetical protein
VARSVLQGCGRRRDVGLEAARRFKEILREGAASQRSLPPMPPPPLLEERRPSGRSFLARRLGRSDDEDQDE